jgi:hypothetical protein
MCVTKRRTPCLEIRTMIPYDGAGDPRGFPAGFQLLRDDRPMGWRHGADSQRFHLCMPEASPSGRHGTQTHTENAPALLGTQWHRMLNQPAPLVGRLLRARQLLSAYAQQPEATRPPGRRRQREVDPGPDEPPHPACTAHTGGGVSDAGDQQPHVAHRRGV